MTDTTDLVERLTVHGLRDGSMKERLLIEARDELTRLRKENEELRAKVSQLKAHLGFWTAAFDDINSLAERGKRRNS